MKGDTARTRAYSLRRHHGHAIAHDVCLAKHRANIRPRMIAQSRVVDERKPHTRGKVFMPLY